MNVRTDFPRRVRELEHVWVTVRDGTRLAARIWLPEDAGADPVPAILEAIPYRKADWTAARDAVRHPWFAGHGYAAVRSTCAAPETLTGSCSTSTSRSWRTSRCIAWLAAQPWCTGDVGMIGISWGGFNGLQVAARRPPALKAVVTLCSTDDRYAQDVHYVGGCVLGIDMLPWASQMLVWNACPPSPANVGERWRELWRERIERTPPYVEEWLAHQRRDGYWKHGSVCEDFAAIACPVLAVGGWADGYTNTVLTLVERLGAPCKGIVGPWAHAFPEEGVPGPAIGFLQECLRWWDRWLKGAATGVEDDPALRAYVEDWTPALAHQLERPGRWVAEDAWPSAAVAPRELALGAGTIRGVQWCGLDSGLWCPYGDAADLPTDQRADDGLSLVFDSPPLDAPLEILGFPEVRLTLAADRRRALVAVRLCDVGPAGESTLVTRGLLNLTHREGHEQPEPLVPGRRYDVVVGLNAAGHRFPPGHRVRVAVSPTYWPFAWPSPEPVTLAVDGGTLVLPVRGGRDGPTPAFEPPESAPPLPVEALEAPYARRTVERDLGTGEVRLDYAYGGGRRRLPGGVELRDDYVERFRIAGDDPLSARVETDHAIELAWAEIRTRVEARSAMWSDAASFHVENRVDAFENGEPFASREWRRSIPRDLV